MRPSRRQDVYQSLAHSKKEHGRSSRRTKKKEQQARSRATRGKAHMRRCRNEKEGITRGDGGSAMSGALGRPRVLRPRVFAMHACV